LRAADPHRADPRRRLGRLTASSRPALPQMQLPGRPSPFGPALLAEAAWGNVAFAVCFGLLAVFPPLRLPSTSVRDAIFAVVFTLVLVPPLATSVGVLGGLLWERGRRRVSER